MGFVNRKENYSHVLELGWGGGRRAREETLLPVGPLVTPSGDALEGSLESSVPQPTLPNPSAGERWDLFPLITRRTLRDHNKQMRRHAALQTLTV